MKPVAVFFGLEKPAQSLTAILEIDPVQPITAYEPLVTTLCADLEASRREVATILAI